MGATKVVPIRCRRHTRPVEIAALIVSLVAVVLAGTAVSAKIRLPAPLVLIAIGAAASYVPHIPTFELSPDVVLFGLLPPLLYATALQTSLVDFNANRGSILRLSILLVVVTTLAVGVVVHALLPSLGWAGAFAIGAIVAPPDAVAATAVARRIGLPRRIVTILEGESLLNDATALVALRTTIAALGVGVTLLDTGLEFVRAAGGGIVLGLVAYFLVAWLRRWIVDPLLDTAISFLTPFAAFLAAESVHASGVIAVVIAGLLLGHRAPLIQTAQSRITERMTWRTAAFILENVVFLLIGLQARWILSDVATSDLGVGRIAAVCLATLASVIVVRLAYVFITQLFIRPGPNAMPATWSLLIGWAGMRGVVTLAAAFLIPRDAPHREVMLLAAFTVVAGTLFLQGLTLPLLTRLLKVPSPDPALDALARATLLSQAGAAGLARLEELEYDDHHGVGERIQTRLDQRTFAAWEQLSTTADEEPPSALYARVRLEMIDAERKLVLEKRSEGDVPAEVIRQVLGMLDIEESMLDAGAHVGEEIRSSTVTLAGTECEDLEAHPVVETTADAQCETCLAEDLRWVALRQCLTCGHVGCCDSSVGMHATEHFHQTQHPVMQSAEPDERWRWCYVHHLST